MEFGVRIKYTSEQIHGDPSGCEKVYTDSTESEHSNGCLHNRLESAYHTGGECRV